METYSKYVAAVCQVAPEYAKPAANRERIYERTAAAVKVQRETRLVVFPETATTGLPGTPSSLEEHHRLEVFFTTAEVVPGPTALALGRLAKESGIYIAAGFIEADPHVRGIIYNSSLLIGPDGGVVAVHRKVQSGGIFKPGSTVEVHETAIGKLGLSICYDQLFPEFVRIQAERGCEVHVNMTANQPLRALSSTLVPVVRAYENTIFVVSANLVGDQRAQGGRHYMGASSITSPFGEIMARAGQEAEETVFGEIDLELITKARARVSPLRDIRKDIYEVAYHPQPRGA